MKRRIDQVKHSIGGNLAIVCTKSSENCIASGANGPSRREHDNGRLDRQYYPGMRIRYTKMSINRRLSIIGGQSAYGTCGTATSKARRSVRYGTQCETSSSRRVCCARVHRASKAFINTPLDENLRETHCVSANEDDRDSSAQVSAVRMGDHACTAKSRRPDRE
jgi:hypothetical protein